MLRKLVKLYFSGSLVLLIVAALILGTLLGWLAPEAGAGVALLGQLFVGGLKAIAPPLVFVLVMAAIVRYKASGDAFIRPILVLYLFGTFAAALVAVAASFLFPTSLILLAPEEGSPPFGIVEVLKTLIIQIVDNPIHALVTANYVGVLAWSVLLGLALRHANEHTKNMISDFSEAVSQVVRWVIRFAPIGVFGLVASTVAETGFSALGNYARLLLVLVGTMAVVAFIVNPLIVFVKIRKNPYPLVFTCLLESGLTAFFTRSSAANIPVNMNLCKKLNLREDMYSVSIPLGATINMGGAAITIAVLSLAAVHTLGIQVDLFTALLLSVLAALGGCGASGVPGGSLLLIPMASSLFGIDNSVAMQVVAVGIIIGVVQDSCETALNSSTDVLFTAAVDAAQKLVSSKA